LGFCPSGPVTGSALPLCALAALGALDALVSVDVLVSLDALDSIPKDAAQNECEIFR
jgi:hypothetical protein